MDILFGAVEGLVGCREVESAAFLARSDVALTFVFLLTLIATLALSVRHNRELSSASFAGLQERLLGKRGVTCDAGPLSRSILATGFATQRRSRTTTVRRTVPATLALAGLGPNALG